MFDETEVIQFTFNLVKTSRLKVYTMKTMR